MSLSPEKLRELCKSFKGQAYYSDAAIPAAKLTNARSALGIPASETIFAMVDLTVFGSATDAIIFASTGIYAKDMGESPQHFRWSEIVGARITASASFFSPSVTFSTGQKLSCSGNRDIVLTLIVPLFQAILEAMEVNEAAEWFVAVDGAPNGPFSAQGLLKRHAEQQYGYNPPVWREGMAAWMPLLSVKELMPLSPPPLARATPSMPPPLPLAGQVPAKSVSQAGAALPPRLSPSITAAKNSGSFVDLNNAPLDELLVLPGFNLANARRLLHERSQRMGFETADEVGEFLKLAPHQLERLRKRIAFRQYVPAGKAMPVGRRIIDF